MTRRPRSGEMEPLREGDRVLLEGAVQASATLGAIVLPGFGPNGLDVLLESPDGHVICSNCGYQTIGSLRLSHPIGILIVKAVSDYHQITGDGSKKMLLVLKGALEELSSLVDYSHLQRSKIEVSQAVQWLKRDVIPELTARLRDETMLCRVVKTRDTLQPIVAQVTSTGYRHRYGHKISRTLQEILSALLLPSNKSLNIDSLKKHVAFTRKNISTLSTHLPGVPMSHSRAIPGFMLDRDLVHPTGKWEFEGCRTLLSIFVLEWSCPYYSSEGSHQPALCTDSLGQLETAVKVFSQLTVDNVRALQAVNIQLVLCSSKVPSAARHELREAGILVVEMVPEDTLQLMAECCGTYPLESIRELRDVDTPTVDLSLSPLDVPLMNPSKRFLCLQLPPDMASSPVSVLLCAPTTGFCRQLESQITNTLQSTLAWCRESSSLAAVAGGGAWEMAMIRQLENCPQDHHIIKHTPKWIAIKALQKGLMVVPHTLLFSSLPSHARRARHATLGLYTRTLTSSESPYAGIDCVNGIIKEVDGDWTVREPYWSQCYLLYSVLSVLAQLLRVDHVVSVHRLKLKLLTEEDSDEL